VQADRAAPCALFGWAGGRGQNASIHFRHTPALLRLTRTSTGAPILKSRSFGMVAR